MPYTPTTWTDEVPGESPVEYDIVDEFGVTIGHDVTITPTSSITPGTALNAANLNHLETGVLNATNTADGAVPKSLATAIGQLLYSTASAVWAALTKPAVTSLLKMTSGGVPSWLDITTVMINWFTGPQTNAGWSNVTKAVGTYTVDLSVTPFGTVPGTAKAVFITLSAQFAGAANGNSINITPQGSTANCLLIRDTISGYDLVASGWVPLNGGKMDVIVAGALSATGVYINIWAYV